MEFWASSETYKLAFPAIDRVRKSLEPALNSALDASDLASVPIKIRYIPITMPEDFLANYPARSKVRKKESIFVCAPQLDYDVFVSGTFRQQITEYARGILAETSELRKLGLSDFQIGEFDAILVAAAERVAQHEDS